MKTTSERLSAEMHVRFSSISNQDVVKLCNIKLFDYFDGSTLMSLLNEARDILELKDTYEHLGRLASNLTRFMMTQCHLLSSLRDCRREFQWQIMTSVEFVRGAVNELYPESHERRKLVDKTLDEFESQKASLDRLGQIVIHGDLSTSNILAKQVSDPRFCLIDFQDIQVAPAVAELSILILYAVIELEQFDLETALAHVPKWIYSSYLRASLKFIDSNELTSYADYIATLMRLRLCQSLLFGQLAFKEDPNNNYVMITNRRGWQLLELLVNDKRHRGRCLVK